MNGQPAVEWATLSRKRTPFGLQVKWVRRTSHRVNTLISKGYTDRDHVQGDSITGRERSSMAAMVQDWGGCDSKGGPESGSDGLQRPGGVDAV